MATKMVVKTKIRVNGKDYAGVEEMPPEIRAAYERAIASLSGQPPQPSGVTSVSIGRTATTLTSTITFNGQTYHSADEMPADVRTLYNNVIATVVYESAGAGEAPHLVHSFDGALSGSSIIRPQSVGPRLIVVAVAILVLVFLAFGRFAVSP